MMAHLEHLRPRTAGRGAGGTSEARPSGSRPWKRTMNATAGSTGFGSGMPGASGLAASPTALRLPMSEEAGKNGVGGDSIAGGGSGWGARRQVAKLRIIFRGQGYRVARRSFSSQVKVREDQDQRGSRAFRTRAKAPMPVAPMLHSGERERRDGRSATTKSPYGVARLSPAELRSALAAVHKRSTWRSSLRRRSVEATSSKRVPWSKSIATSRNAWWSTRRSQARSDRAGTAKSGSSNSRNRHCCKASC